MKFETDLHRAQGLGSAKSGLRHWMIQRITAVALIPLGIWFVAAFILLISAPYDESIKWLSSIWTVTLAISFIMTMFYHGYLGMQVIWEDYISHELTKWIVIILTKFLSVIIALLAIVAILKIFLS